MAHRHEFNDNYFAEHYRTHYRKTGRPYGEYKTAYRYGWDASQQDHNRTRTWGEVISRLHTTWGIDHPNHRWDDIAEAVHEGYNQGQIEIAHETQEVDSLVDRFKRDYPRRGKLSRTE
jgi:hypothetical protein